MTAQPHRSQPIIPRPERTPRALRLALAGVAPHRIQAFEEQKDQALAMAAESGSITPVRAFLLAWATTVEIERDPDTARRFHAAEHAAHVLDKDHADWHRAMREITTILDEAQKAVES
ncbi:DUF6247 family protein [Yinghuangia sp. ASG 101]|uniref:DUF6247 family protein n=1 Tax=Yinghuangia sp. ASG 101 TaxID=2896848 RepID=UPI001E44EA8D|nr:DUF6247 family protein [Yinghuangia sp. ASG 101]UGQ10382.1 DUF6247 family protein [Yinghuangia sp. ASG 101]